MPARVKCVLSDMAEYVDATYCGKVKLLNNDLVFFCIIPKVYAKVSPTVP